MAITPYHAKLFAHDLTRRSADDDTGRLSSALSDAQVDLNPHQIEAALFALRNPFSNGVILADEVGLGKTIEAGLLLSQLWAERRRKLLIILPANLRKQWSQELADKFHLPSIILEAKSFNEAIRGRNLNPFVQPQIVLCSFQFARTKDTYLQQVAWDLVVIDEAHRLRNVYRGSNKIANAIKQAVAPYTKVLLTATPLQNSLLELYLKWLLQIASGLTDSAMKMQDAVLIGMVDGYEAICREYLRTAISQKKTLKEVEYFLARESRLFHRELEKYERII